MSIAALSRVSASLPRSLPRIGAAPRVAAVERVASVEAAAGLEAGGAEAAGRDEEAAPSAEATPSWSGRRPDFDPRGPGWLGLGPAADADPARPSERRIAERLAELYGEKARIEGKASAERNRRQAELSRVLDALKSRDTAVRAHEAAHVAAGGRYIRGGATYSYQRGPDGRDYAVGGEVGIDSSPDPAGAARTVEKMRVVRAAALAPADPSAADLSVAAAAAIAEAAALAELAAERGKALEAGIADARNRG